MEWEVSGQFGYMNPGMQGIKLCFYLSSQDLSALWILSLTKIPIYIQLLINLIFKNRTDLHFETTTYQGMYAHPKKKMFSLHKICSLNLHKTRRKVAAKTATFFGIPSKIGITELKFFLYRSNTQNVSNPN